MIDKSLVKKRFSKSLKTYSDNAIIQKKMAEKLISLLPRNNYNSVFEIGCASGILTEQISKKLIFKEFTGNDLVEKSKEYVDKIIPDNSFITGDIEEINLNKKYDLIISNASLQWCENPLKTIEKLYSRLNTNGVLAISVFGNNNLKELKSILNLNTLNTNLKGIEEEYTLYFNSPVDILKHLKATGANALTEYKFTKNSLKKFEEEYKKNYSEGNKVKLTYNPMYLIKVFDKIK